MTAYPRCRLDTAWLRAAVVFVLVSALAANRATTHTAFAASYVVNVMTDTFDGSCGDGTCTLRDAILAANTSPGADTITFSVSGTIVLGSALPSIIDELTIDGSGQAITVDGNDAVRVFRGAAPLTLKSLTVQNGHAAVEGGGGVLFGEAGTLIDVTLVDNTASGDGGGALFESLATITDTIFQNNTALSGDGGGALFNEPADITGTSFLSNAAPNGEGGGAFFVHAATVEDAAFTSNSAQLGGGARFGGLATVASTDFLSNTATAGNGGGARFGAQATVTGTTFTGNTAASGDGGGARFDGVTTLSAVAFSGNSASNLGGGASFIQVASVTGATFVSNSAAVGGGGADFDQTAALTATAFLTNTSPSGSGGGAGFAGVAILKDTTFAGNSAGGTGGGGGARFLNTTTITGGSFQANTATNGTGGGARFVGEAQVTGTAFTSNLASNGSGGGAHFLGGATVSGAAFMRNQAVQGGALYVDSGASLTLDNSLLAANTASDSAGASEIALAADGTDLTGRHNTLAAAVPGNGLAVSADNGPNGQVALTNVIFDSYAVGVQAGASEPEIVLEGVLWSGTAAPTQGNGIVVGSALNGSAAFVNRALDNYHLQRTSDAVDAGGDAGLATDFDGDARPQYAAFDLGFDELLNAHAPQALGDTDTTPEDTSTALDVLDNDSDGDGDPLSLSTVGASSFGTAAISGAEIIFTPTSDFNGQAVFTYTVTDGGLTGTASVTVTVSPLPDAPTAVDDEAGTPEDTPITLMVLDNDLNPDGHLLSVSAVGSPDVGTAAISGTTQILYTPAPEASGPAVFTYTLSDGTFTSTARVTVTVAVVNDDPTISAIDDIHLPSGGATGPLAFTVNDVESGSALTVTASSSNPALVPNANIVLAGSGADRTVSITPAGLSGQTLITLTVTDGEGGTTQMHFTVTVGYRLLLPVLVYLSN